MERKKVTVQNAHHCSPLQLLVISYIFDTELLAATMKREAWLVIGVIVSLYKNIPAAEKYFLILKTEKCFLNLLNKGCTYTLP